MKRVIAFSLALLIAVSLICSVAAGIESENGAPPISQSDGAEIKTEESAAESTIEDIATQVPADTGEEANPADLGFLDGLDSILDPNDNSIGQNANAVLEKYSDNPLVRFFQKLIHAIVSFLTKLFAFASEVAKVEVS